MNPLVAALAIGGVSVLIRILPEVWLRGRPAPTWLRDTFPWLPIAITGVFAGIMHVPSDGSQQLPYIVAGLVGLSTWLYRKTFYLPLLAGVVTLAVWRHFVPM